MSRDDLNPGRRCAPDIVALRFGKVDDGAMNQSRPNQGDRQFGMRCFAYTYSFSNRRQWKTVNAELIGASYHQAVEA